MDGGDGVAIPVDQAHDIHPKLRDLYRFWERKRASRALPLRADLDVIELWPWLGNLMLLEVEGDGTDFIYRVYGTTIADYFGRDLTGRRTSSLATDVRTVVRAEYHEVMMTARPIIITRARSVQMKRVRASKLILPLGADRHAVDHLLVGVYLAMA